MLLCEKFYILNTKILMTSKNAINLCSLNVNGMHLKEKRNRVIEWIKAQKSLITFLQEAHFDVNIENYLNHKSDYDVFCSHGTTASRGVAFFMNKSLHYELINKYNDTDGRLILINVEINNTIFTLVCIYAPNCRSSRNSFFKKVSDKIQEHGIGIPIVGGDFNETLKVIDRKTSRSNQNNQPISSLKNLI